MRLWELRPIDKDSGPWEPWYDKAFGFVVRADTEAQARCWHRHRLEMKKRRHGSMRR